MQDSEELEQRRAKAKRKAAEDAKAAGLSREDTTVHILCAIVDTMEDAERNLPYRDPDPPVKDTTPTEPKYAELTAIPRKAESK